ncbi:MAG: phosphoglycerate dehydrogenase-like enzyme [Gammaproteobacteria bacterium]|jgi:phosphoglycerate dehydrogenase-like enzyme
MRIGLCIRGFTRVLEILKQELPHDEVYECDADEVIALAPETDVFLPTVAPIPAAAFAAPRLKLVQQYGVGLDSVDIPAATASGVLVANVPSVGTGNAESVAELAIAHMLMLSRHMPLAFTRFKERKVGGPLGNCIWQSTVAIVGYGGIGEEIARRLAGFGVKIIAISRSGPTGSRQRDPSVSIDLHVSAREMHDVIGEADYVIVAAPASPENIGLVDSGLIARMKRGTYIVNIARGPVIDYDALLAALREGHVAGAGLDVFWSEPFNPNDGLLNENVIATPHVGGNTARSLLGIGQAVAENVERIRRGEPPLCWVNPGAGQRRIAG